MTEEAIEAAVMKLRAALKPFADIAEWDIGDSESDSDTFRPIDPRCSISGNISIGHLRRALEAVEESEWMADKIRARQIKDTLLKGLPLMNDKAIEAACDEFWGDNWNLPEWRCDPELVGAMRRAIAAYERAMWSDAARDVLAERQRQIDAEGWTPEHDDEHVDGSLLNAALCYAQRRSDARMFGYDVADFPAPARWPWCPEWWKPKDERRDLIRAAALILAEIERLDRASARPLPSVPEGEAHLEQDDLGAKQREDGEG